jgi:hypothetical protein
MRLFRDQTLATTNPDRQGERLTKDFLERHCASMAQARFPVHQQHDMRKRVLGYIENARLIPDPNNPEEWRLIGDVYVDQGALDDALAGFSISGVETMFCAEEATAMLYLPFPHYNDNDLVAKAIADPELSVGKWIKKSAEPLDWALLGSAFAFAITPIWDDVYKRKIAPRIDELLARLLPIFQKKGLATELIQIILLNSVEVEVRIIPVRGKEKECLHSRVVGSGLRMVVAFLTADPKATSIGVKRVVIFFDEVSSVYKLHRLEYADGQVEHVA